MTTRQSEPDDADRVEPRQSIVDVLLDEALGGTPTRDLTATVLARLAAGDAAGAAARADASAREPGAKPTTARTRPWLVAALMLLGLGVVLAIAISRTSQADVSSQDPTEEEVVPVRDLDHLRELLPQVTGVVLEVLRLPDANLPFDVELAGVPVRATPATCDRLRVGLAEAARLEPPAGWDWQNQLSLLLPEGRHIAMAIYPYDTGQRQTIGVRGLQGDLSVDGGTAAQIRELLDTATHVARIAHGVVLGEADLRGPDGFPDTLEELRLFQVDDDALRLLARFTALRRLDCSGLRRTLTADGLRHVRRCTGLQQLSLAGAALTDDDLRLLLAELRELRRLDLRGARGLTGDAFRDDPRRSDGPTAIDLRDVPTLTDAGLVALGGHGPRELLLGGSGDGISQRGWRALMAARRIVHLDLSKWSLDTPRLLDLRHRPGLEVLLIERCGLDNTALELLAGTNSTLRRLSIRGNAAVTIAGIEAVAGIPTIRELDMRGVGPLDADALARVASMHPDVRFVR